MTVKILVVEDEKIVAKDIQNRLKNFGYHVPAIASSGEEAIKKAAEFNPDLILMDIMLNKSMDGVETAKKIREMYDIPVVYLTAYADDSTLQRAKLTEPFGYILKPFEERELYTTIEMALYKHKMEKKLKESEQWFATTLKCIGEAVIATNRERLITFMNPVAEMLTGWKLNEALGKNLMEVFKIVDDSRKNLDETPITRSFKRNASISTINHTLISKNGTERAIDANASPIRDDKGNIAGVVMVFRDITERRRVEEQLREQAALLNKAQDAIIVRDMEDRIVFWNKSAEDLYGWTAVEAVSKIATELLNKGDLTQFNEARREVLEKKEWRGELRQVAKSGKDVIVESRWSLIQDREGKPKSILLVNTDITDRKKLAAQFLRTQRMDSIGTLAGGIAHDLNNVLAPILMSVQILRKRFTDERSQQVLSTLEQSAQRGADMVKQVLSFARGIEGERVILQPKHLIVDIQRMMNEAFPKSIQIETSVRSDLCTVIGDATQLYQVLMNLCVNARDAMPNGGKLTVEAENIYLDENYARMHMEAVPGQFVLIKVSDTGIGIQAPILDKIFEPFFTTKEIGKGTGLGLSTVLGIVKSHDGFIDVSSSEGKGSTFKIYLPAAESPQVSQLREEREELPLGHGELIFVVDDEAPIRQITKSTLEVYGYNVITADDGAEAVALYAENRDKIAAVLMDMMMPYMDGVAAIRALQKLDPDVRIIAASGLMSASNASDIPGINVRAFLPKPYTAEKLLKVLAETLKN
jgi:PAS domain S-box-containing protein